MPKEKRCLTRKKGYNGIFKKKETAIHKEKVAWRPVDEHA